MTLEGESTFSIRSIGLKFKERQNDPQSWSLDDLANTVALGEHVRLLGRISRVFAEEDRLRYNHGIRFEVHNILREPDCKQAGVPDAIAALIYSTSRP